MSPVKSVKIQDFRVFVKTSSMSVIPMLTSILATTKEANIQCSFMQRGLRVSLNVAVWTQMQCLLNLCRDSSAYKGKTCAVLNLGLVSAYSSHCSGILLRIVAHECSCLKLKFGFFWEAESVTAVRSQFFAIDCTPVSWVLVLSAVACHEEGYMPPTWLNECSYIRPMCELQKNILRERHS